MKWYLRITTKKGRTFEFPYDGYKTKREAISQKALADKEPQILSVIIVKK